MQTLGIFYTAVVQAVLLYRLETWVMSLWIGKTLGGFHHQVIRKLTGLMPQRNGGRTWPYPPMEEMMVEARMQEVDTYVDLCQNTVTQFITTRPIMGLFIAVVQRPGARVSKRWWE